LTLLVYPLVVHEESQEAIRAGRIYLTYLLVGETLVFAALFIIWGVAGYVPAFTTGGLAVGIGLSGRTALAVAVLAFAGFSVKAAVMPMHGWLPDAMIAPTPVSAVLHAVAVVNVGVLGILSLLYYVVGAGVGRELGLDGALPWVAAVTIIYGSVIALRQDEIKRRLAYSTVSQLGYMVMGAALLDRPGLRGAVLHMFAHSLMKIVLFFCAGIIITRAGKRFFSQIGGLARTMPVTMACFTVGAMGMVGLPPAVGWVSKWTLLEGVFSTGRYAFVIVMLVSAILNLGYYFPPIMAAYFEKPPKGDEPRSEDGPPEHEDEHADHASGGHRLGSWVLEAPLSMLGPTVAITLAVLLFGVWPRFPYWLADKVVTSALGVAGGG
jgi:multicomponent Na+:H+ antiporter subunit D